MTSSESTTPKIFTPEIKRILGFGLIISMFINVLYLTYPLFMLQVFDRVLPTRNIDTLLLLLVFAVIGITSMCVLYYIRGKLFIRLSVLVDTALSEKTLRTSLAIGRLSGQRIRDAALNHVNAIKTYMSGDGIFALYDLPWVPLFLGIIFLIHPLLGFVALLGAIVTGLLALLAKRIAEKEFLASNAARAKSQEQVNQAMANDVLIEAMGMRSSITARWRRHHYLSMYHGAVAGERVNIIMSITRGVRVLIMIALMTTAVLLILAQAMNPGAMMVAIILIGRALGPVEQGISSWRSYLAAREGHHQLTRLFQAAPAERTGLSLPAPTGQLSVNGVSYHPFGSQRLILRNVSFSLPAGTALGVVGPSGAGKSTLMRLLIGVIPPIAGKVRLDGVDLTEWNKEEIGPHIGFLPQEVDLFEGTIAENIARLQSAPASMVIEAARLAGVHDMILRMPLGYDTVVGPGGMALSGGQRQRIALARAVFGLPRLLVLDEPNSNLDAEGEEALINALKTMKGHGSTIVMVSHRMNALSFTDMILVMKDGMVQSFGPRQEAVPQATRIDFRKPKPAAADQKHA